MTDEIEKVVAELKEEKARRDSARNPRKGEYPKSKRVDIIKLQRMKEEMDKIEPELPKGMARRDSARKSSEK